MTPIGATVSVAPNFFSRGSDGGAGGHPARPPCRHRAVISSMRAAMALAVFVQL
jgi:hypothetical protein